MADNNTSQERPRGIEALKQHIIENKVDVALWASRVLTIIFAIGYVLPIFGLVLISGSHRSAININFFPITICFFFFWKKKTIFLCFVLQNCIQLILQSIISKCGYKCITFATANATFNIYTGIFCNAFGWRFLSLLVLFDHIFVRRAIHFDFIAGGFVCYFTRCKLFTHTFGCKLNVALRTLSYSYQNMNIEYCFLILFQTLGQNSWWGARLMISIVELQTSNILRFAALSEILLMPFAIISVFS